VKFAGWHGVIVGLLMRGQWGFFTATGQVPELQTEPLRIYIHLAGELATAAGLLASGIARCASGGGGPPDTRWRRACSSTRSWSARAASQQGQWAFVGMFAVLFILALGSIAVVARSRRP